MRGTWGRKGPATHRVQIMSLAATGAIISRAVSISSVMEGGEVVVAVVETSALGANSLLVAPG
jgi:hypothetical protein